MCVIIHKPAGVRFPVEDIKRAYDRNHDGFGYMYYDPKLKKIVAAKKIYKEKELQEIIDIFESQVDLEVCYHFRFRTHGKLADPQCHPFKVLDEKRNGTGMYMMHNGVISGMTTAQSEESDTQGFNRLVLQPVLKQKPSLINTPAFQFMLAEVVGGGNKLLFMYGDGKVVKINEKAGDTHAGCWVSNKSPFYQYTGSKNGGNNHTGSRSTGHIGNDMDAGFGCGAPGENGKVVHAFGASKNGNLMGEAIKVGDTVNCFHHSNNAYWSEGTIVEIWPLTCMVELENTEGKKDKILFSLKDGEAYQKNKGYIIHPPSFSDPTLSKTVKDMIKLKKQDGDPVVENAKKEETAAEVEEVKKKS